MMMMSNDNNNRDDVDNDDGDDVNDDDDDHDVDDGVDIFTIVDLVVNTSTFLPIHLNIFIKIDTISQFNTTQ